jgi:hypothetical protein
LKEVEAGVEQEGLKDENTHSVSISLNKLQKGVAEEVENYIIEGSWDASVTVGNSFIIVENDKGKNTFIWNSKSKKMENI